MNHDGDLVEGARMAAVALLSAVVTAAVVIAFGQSLIGAPEPAPSARSGTVLVRTVG